MVVISVTLRLNTCPLYQNTGAGDSVITPFGFTGAFQVNRKDFECFCDTVQMNCEDLSHPVL